MRQLLSQKGACRASPNRQTDTRDPTGQTFLNPTVLFEVTSPTSAAYDLGEKFRYYREIDTLRDYVVLRQDRTEVTVKHRAGDGKAYAGDIA